MPNFKEGIPRNQYLMFPEIVDDYINEENPVRFIDAFVDSLDLLDIGFKKAIAKDRGTSAYNPKDLLKLYIYGYLNKIRSSRKLENEIQRNVELMWLLRKLKPDFKTIADFRKDNLKGIQNVCRQFTVICKELDLLGGELIAVDGSKFKACNNNDKNYTQESLAKELSNVDKKIDEYLKGLDSNDKNESGHKKLNSKELHEKIEKLKTRKAKYDLLKENIGEDNQISLTDPESRLMKDKNSFIVGYNIQTAVDSKNNLIVASDVVNDVNDKNQLSSIVSKAQEILESDKLKVTADKGYYNEIEIIKVVVTGVIPYVFKPLGSPNDKKELFTYHDFSFNKEKDVYICPANQELKFRGFGKSKERKLMYYWTKSCSECILRDKCTRDKGGRRIGRSINADVLESMEKRMKDKPEVGALRKQMVEHPFGTIKRAFEQQYFLLKGLEKVKAEISLSVLSYNMKRVINILGVKTLIQHLTT